MRTSVIIFRFVFVVSSRKRNYQLVVLGSNTVSTKHNFSWVCKYICQVWLLCVCRVSRPSIAVDGFDV